MQDRQKYRIVKAVMKRSSKQLGQRTDSAEKAFPTLSTHLNLLGVKTLSSHWDCICMLNVFYNLLASTP